MSFFKYLLVIVLVQIATALSVLFASGEMQGAEWLRILIPLIITAIAAAFWLQTFSTHYTKHVIAKLKEDHAKEREKIRVNAERAKTRLVKKNQQEMVEEVRKTQSSGGMKQNMKMAGIVTVTAAAGGLLLLSNFMLMGLLAITTAGGAAGGYWARLRQEKGKPMLPFKRSNPPKVIHEVSSNKP